MLAAGAHAVIDLSRENLRDTLREQVYAATDGRHAVERGVRPHRAGQLHGGPADTTRCPEHQDRLTGRKPRAFAQCAKAKLASVKSPTVIDSSQVTRRWRGSHAGSTFGRRDLGAK